MNWVPVTDRLPTEDGKYLIYAPSADPDKPFIHVAWYDPGFGWSLLPQVWVDAITHWMEFPGPPEEER